MPAPSYAQISGFGKASKQLEQAAFGEFMEHVYDGMTHEELVDVAASIAAKYSFYGCELGAQWYDLCSQAAGLDVDPAEYGDPDPDAMRQRAEAALENVEPTDAPKLNTFLQDLINDSIRMTGYDNLWRDYERGMCGGKWCRVPVGDTCAWCLMLASQGAWYLTEKSAIGADPGHYHSRCDCVAVYHADAESIAGYRNLERYKETYYNADNVRQAAESGRTPYHDELRERVEAAKVRHEQLEDEKEAEAAARGEEYRRKPWTVYNEDLLIIRYTSGVS